MGGLMIAELAPAGVSEVMPPPVHFGGLFLERHGGLGNRGGTYPFRNGVASKAGRMIVAKLECGAFAPVTIRRRDIAGGNGGNITPRPATPSPGGEWGY